MAHIQWNTRFDTGIEIIDLQHRKIIGMINDLHDSSLNQDRVLIDDVLQHMREYVSEHFSFEEELMRAADYPYLNAHSQLHQRFMERLEGMSERHACGEEIQRELSSFLTKWLTHHIGHEDQDYVTDVSRIMSDICA